MLKQLEASLKKTNDVKDDYFKLGTEQKAYMNQLRTRMYNDKAISSLEEPVSTALIKKYMDSLGDKDSIKRAYLHILNGLILYLCQVQEQLE